MLNIFVGGEERSELRDGFDAFIMGFKSGEGIEDATRTLAHTFDVVAHLIEEEINESKLVSAKEWLISKVVDNLLKTVSFEIFFDALVTIVVRKYDLGSTPLMAIKDALHHVGLGFLLRSGSNERWAVLLAKELGERERLRECEISIDPVRQIWEVQGEGCFSFTPSCSSFLR